MTTLSNQPIIILGPTASGKTDLGIRIAQQCNGEILSADSRQIYVGMNIGTAKACARADTKLRRQEPILCNNIPHYLIDILMPNQRYSAAEFRDDAHRIIHDIAQRNRRPIIVGGTGFYVRVLTGDRLLPHVPPDPEFRAWAEKQPTAVLLSELQNIDTEAAHRVKDLDHRRIARALEVAKSNPDIHAKDSTDNEPFSFQKYAILPDRDELRERIKQRTTMMFADGLADEVKNIVRIYGKDAPGLQTIGYREVIPFTEGMISKQEAIDAVFHATWHYARRQMNWLKKEPRLVTGATAEELIQKISLQ